MKYLLIPILCLSLVSCKQEQVTDASITTVISLATSLTFKYALADQDKRKTIAKYVSGIAGSVRGLTGTETAQQVAQILTNNIPPNILQQYPEIGTIVIPQVVNYYESAKLNFSSDAKAFVGRMNAIASGLEQGVAAFL